MAHKTPGMTCLLLFGCVALTHAGSPLDRMDLDVVLSAHPRIHSAAVIDLETGQLRGSRLSATRPRSVASTIKLAVVNAVLREVADRRVRLDEVLTVRGPNDQSHDGEPIGQTYTVAEALHSTLKRSSNTAPNLLALRMGGLAGLNSRLGAMGYENTAYNYLSSLRRTEQVRGGSTARDMARVARDFWSRYRLVQGLGPGTAWDGFSHAKDVIRARGHETIGGKIGSNSLSATHTGIYRIEGRVWGIVVFSEEDGLRNDYQADRLLEAATTAIADGLAAGEGPQSGNSGPTASEPSFSGIAEG